MTTRKEILALSKQFCKENSYTGREKLMCVHTGAVDTASSWAVECAERVLDSDGVDSVMINDDGFSSLVHVRKNRAGDYVAI